MLHRRSVLALSGFLALSCLAGGVPILLTPHGNDTFLPIAILEPTPFESFVIPALLLLLVGGGTQAAAFVATLRRSPLAADLTILAGGAMTVWIVCELSLIRQFSWLQVVYGLGGAALLALGIHAAWRSGEARHRWVITVTSFEALGFLVPALTATLATAAGLDASLTAVLVVVAGAFEGLALGTGQAVAFPFPVDRRRYATVSALGAATAWALALSAVAVGASAAVPSGLAALYGVLAGLCALAALVGAQGWVLRRHSTTTSAWLGWATLAWIVALPLSFTPSSLVDETTPLDTQLVLWPSAGLFMAYVMAVVTWQGARRVARSSHPAPSEDLWQSSSSSA